MTSLKMTQKELEVLLNKQKISLDCSSRKKNKDDKISISNEIHPKKSSAPVNINKVIQNTKTSIIKYSISENHLSIIFEEAILLSINQIFAFLQIFQIFTFS